ncbi:MAG: diadenylate cyclase CdaA [Oscillospiraceae bacterium]|nr:diadenylate cyclase CdaA [Oscillospiraceae bacterium]
MTQAWQEIATFFERVWAILLSFQPKDALDILFVAAIIYGLIRLMRETRSVQLLKGLFFVLLAWGVIKALHMNASETIFRNVIDNFALLLLLLFQPEIRSLFERVGVSSLKLLPQKSANSRAVQEAAIGQVCAACAELSQDRIGALLVFEQETMLGEIIKTGTPVEAKVTRQLISNIFYPKAPLHDGAVVVRRGKLEAAGCILPLTQNADLDTALGTRHRAALGITEQSDALAVVVSEETGGISLAQKGSLRRELCPTALETALKEAMLAPEAVKRAVGFFRQHLPGVGNADTAEEDENAKK